LSGLQGSGKSTLARVMKAQAEARGWPTEVLSLDDFYYARSDREALAHQSASAAAQPRRARHA
jgi:D-glycerate 3-kinase